MAAAALSSCSLDRQPLTALSDDTFWNDASKAELALTGCYRGNIVANLVYQPYDVWTYYGLILMDHLSDNCFDRRGVGNPFFMISSGGLVAGNAQMKDYWTSAYKRIGNCNRFIAGMESTGSTSDDMTTMLGEARFLRATMYFYLASYFKDVPLVTVPLSGEEANNVSKTSQAEILEWCAKELEEAAAAMPTFANAKKGHANRQTALAFLGRTRMLQEKWSEGAAAYKQIIDLGENSIHPVYKELFLPGTGINNNENLFYINFSQNNMGCGYAQHALSPKDGGWALSNPAASLFEAYEFTDGTPFSYDDPRYEYPDLGKNRDPRLDYTIYYNGAMFMGTEYNQHPDNESGNLIQVNYVDQVSRTGLMPRKYIKEDAVYVNLEDHDMVIPVMRYAEVLLGYLECLVESNSPVTQAVLDQTINAVRGRADVKMPAVTTTDPAQLREKVRHERRVELAYEGTRYWDIMRWKIAHEVLVGDVFGAPFPDAKFNTTPDAEGINKPTKPDPTGHGRWWVGERNFRNPQDYTWPIPQSEQDLNPNLRAE